MLPHLLTSTLLLFAPVAPPSPEVIVDDDLAPELSPEFVSALEYLSQVDSEANGDADPLAASAALVEALASLADYAPEVAASPMAKELRELARLNLARTYLIAGEAELAAQAMDDAIREGMGAELQAEVFGPSLAEFYAQRVAALEEVGRANLIVSCARACTIYINETAIEPDQTPHLPLGSYRVWVEDPTGDVPRKRELVQLSEPDQVYEVVFAPAAIPAAPPKPPPKPKRIMPRGAEIVLLVVGAGLTATGAALVASNDRLEIGPMVGGALGLAVGAGFLTSGVITLTIDERKLARGVEHQATLAWTMKF
jgi:hypothetical protein